MAFSAFLPPTSLLRRDSSPLADASLHADLYGIAATQSKRSRGWPSTAELLTLAIKLRNRFWRFPMMSRIGRILCSALVLCLAAEFASALGMTPNAQTATPSAQTATPAPQTATPSAQTATPVPQTATPSAQTATPVPQTATPSAQTATPVPQTATPSAQTATPRPQSTNPSTGLPCDPTLTPGASTIPPTSSTSTSKHDDQSQRQRKHRC
jgi:hypothetical protein